MLAAVHHLSLSWQAEHEGNDIHIRHVCRVSHCIIYKEHVHMGKQQLSYMYGNYRFLHTHAAHTAAPNTAAAHYSSSLACPCIALTATPHYSVWEKAVGFCPQLSVTSCRSLLYPAPKARCMLFSRPGSGLVPRSNTFYLSSLMLRYTRTIKKKPQNEFSLFRWDRETWIILSHSKKRKRGSDQIQEWISVSTSLHEKKIARGKPPSCCWGFFLLQNI